MPVLSTTQMTLNFEAGMSNEYNSLKEFIRDEALPKIWREQKKPRKYVAGDMDLSQTELTRKLADNPNDPRNFTTDDLEKYLATQNDLSPIYYLLDKYGRSSDKEKRKAELLAELAALDSQK